AQDRLHAVPELRPRVAAREERHPVASLQEASRDKLAKILRAANDEDAHGELPRLPFYYRPAKVSRVKRRNTPAAWHFGKRWSSRDSGSSAGGVTCPSWPCRSSSSRWCGRRRRRSSAGGGRSARSSRSRAWESASRSPAMCPNKPPAVTPSDRWPPRSTPPASTR